MLAARPDVILPELDRAEVTSDTPLPVTVGALAHAPENAAMSRRPNHAAVSRT